MKRLTYFTMARARLRANGRQYWNLLIGIFLSIFLVTSLTIAIYGIFLAQQQRRYREIGYMDAVVLENYGLGQEQLERLGIFDKIGHSYISGVVTDRNLNVGFYDKDGQDLMNLVPTQGRLPVAAGEIAVEPSALDVLEIDCEIGDTVNLNITPVDGVEESRKFTLVGLLPERSERLANMWRHGIQRFPAIVTSLEEPAFAVSRLGLHYIMQLKQGVSRETCFWALDSASIEARSFGCYICLSFSGEEMGVDGNLELRNPNSSIAMWITRVCVLVGSLLLCCGIGIYSAMESMLSGRQEEIGILRAVGATRRQIRRMFGRENWILALVVSPLSLGAGVLAMWALGRWLPEGMLFRFQPWLLLPIGVISVIVILLSGFLPLLRASRNLPMGVIRNTAMLRRSKRIKTKKFFSPSRLLSSRQLRFHPARQIGTAALVCLMLVSSGMVAEGVVGLFEATLGDKPAFELRIEQPLDNSYSVYRILGASVSRQTMTQIAKLNHVRSVGVRHNVPVTMLLDRVPRSALNSGDVNMGMLDDSMFEDYVQIYWTTWTDRAYLEQAREKARIDFQKFLDEYGINGFPLDVYLSTVSEKTLNGLTDSLESGKIDLDAINAGREVIAVVQDKWATIHENSDKSHSIHYWWSERQARLDAGQEAIHVAWNDSFASGQKLPIAQLYQTEEGGTVNRKDRTVVVGGIYPEWVVGTYNSRNDINLITTEQGLANMKLESYGIQYIDIYLDDGLTQEEEVAVSRRIHAIGRRISGSLLTDQLAQIRDSAERNRQQILTMGCMCVVFFAVSVGLLVSSVTRQLQSEGRTIGMLRAVGADERMLLQAYGGQFKVAITVGLVLCLLIFLADGISVSLYMKFILTRQELYSILREGAASCVMAFACMLACRLFLRLQIRQLLKKSIIDTIREL